MPNRILRDYTESAPFDGISPEAERLWTRLLTKADDFGRYHTDARLVKASCFPLLDNLRSNDVIRWLDELSDRHLIFRYEVDGRGYLAITRFRQRLRVMKSKFPPPDGQPEDWFPSDDRQMTVKCQTSVPLKRRGNEEETKRSRNDDDIQDDKSSSSSRDMEFACMEADAAFALLKREHPDIDVMGEYRRLKTLCQKDGKKPSWREFLAWLRKASPIIKPPKERQVQPEIGERVTDEQWKQCAEELSKLKSQMNGAHENSKSDC